LEISQHVKSVFAIEVSNEISSGINPPDNFQLLITDGLEIPVNEKSIDIAYSNQLLEHLHPDDARIQLKNIYDSLNYNAKYICITPNRHYGPHDISKYFDDEATGFHLKEYTISEVISLFKNVGFSKFDLYAGGRGIFIKFPVTIAIWTEKVIMNLPKAVSRILTSFILIKAILGINIVAYKEK
jgi:hypothetical protein